MNRVPYKIPLRLNPEITWEAYRSNNGVVELIVNIPREPHTAALGEILTQMRKCGYVYRNLVLARRQNNTAWSRIEFEPYHEAEAHPS